MKQQDNLQHRNCFSHLRAASRVSCVMQSEIRAMSIESDKIKGINLSQGIIDTEVPSVVRDAAKRAIDSGVNTYTRYDGIQVLREAIAKKQNKFNGLEYDPDNEIVVSSGATGALYCACLALLEPEDEVIVFEPYYGYHVSTLMITGVVPVFVRLHSPGWSFERRDIEKVITSKTRGIIINTPANPSGKVFSKDELELIVEIAQEKDFFIFTDEIYEHFIYDGKKHVSVANIADAKNRTIVISGLSKTFSITGWRIGYALCDKKWAEVIGYLNDLIYVCAPSPLQLGVAEGILSLGNAYYDFLNTEYHLKRDKICNALKSAGLAPYVPQGSYYVLADISKIPGRTGKEKVMNILKAIGIAVVPGEAFYHDDSGKTLARFCFAKENHILDEACKRIMDLKNKFG